MKYSTYRKYVDRKVNSLPIAYAIGFNKESYKRNLSKAMAKLGLWDDQINLVHFDSCGLLYKKKDKPLFDFVMCERETLCKYLIETDDEFFVDAAKHELANHECCISGRFAEALAAIYLSINDIRSNERKKRLYAMACKEYDKECEKLGLI
jgi:hypothetical protein